MNKQLFLLLALALSLATCHSAPAIAHPEGSHDSISDPGHTWIYWSLVYRSRGAV
jgi:hypothetical protein